MGIVEGITEWLPISSTGHMILLEQIIKFNASEEFMSMFRVVIQLGAIMAVVVLFWGKLWPFGMKQGRVISKPSVWSLWFKVVAATIPVLIISPLDDWMEAHFYNYITVAAMLILYGALFFVVENRRAAPHVSRLEQITYRDAIIIGLWQCLAIIPGTSRSGATIVGGLLLGLSRACVAEFTFYLAIPVMAGASLLKVVKFVVGGSVMTGTEVAVLAVGCVVAFGMSLAAIRFLMDYVKRHDFKFFGAYRIVLGIIVLAVAAATACMLYPDHPLYNVNDVFNAIFVHGNVLGDAMFYGSGAGKLPTASAVVADVVDEAKHLNRNIMTMWKEEKLQLEDKADSKRRFFVRIKGDKEKLIPQLKESYGEIEVVNVPELEDEFGFVTPVMMEGDYETRSKLYKEQIVHMIRIQD